VFESQVGPIFLLLHKPRCTGLCRHNTPYKPAEVDISQSSHRSYATTPKAQASAPHRELVGDISYRSQIRFLGNWFVFVIHAVQIERLTVRIGYRDDGLEYGTMVGAVARIQKPGLPLPFPSGFPAGFPLYPGLPLPPALSLSPLGFKPSFLFFLASLRFAIFSFRFFALIAWE
jgi:hypothetical protein